jgi:hypothetical protein
VAATQSREKRMTKLPEVTEAEIDVEPEPDVVEIVNRQVKKFMILQRKRQLNQSETYQFNKCLDFMMKIEIHKIQSQEKEREITPAELAEIIKSVKNTNTSNNVRNATIDDP